MKPRNGKPQEELFPFVEMAKLVPEHHILRLIDRYVDFSFVDDLVELQVDTQTLELVLQELASEGLLSAG